MESRAEITWRPAIEGGTVKVMDKFFIVIAVVSGVCLLKTNSIIHFKCAVYCT